MFIFAALEHVLSLLVERGRVLEIKPKDTGWTMKGRGAYSGWLSRDVYHLSEPIEEEAAGGGSDEAAAAAGGADEAAAAVTTAIAPQLLAPLEPGEKACGKRKARGGSC